MRFDRFMELALYHPRLGYYSSGRTEIGKRGDFYTSVSVGALFGELLALQFVEMWELLGRPKTFYLVEAGAHHGNLATDILDWLRQNHPDVASACHYIIIEPSPALQRRQRKTVQADLPVKWVSKLSEIRHNSLVGCIFSNELLDVFPVRRITWSNGHWRDVCVDWREERFVYTVGRFCEAAHQFIADSQSRPTFFPERYTTEVCPAAEKWVHSAVRRLKRGWLLFFDYGYEASEYFAPHRTDGTLRCYYRHQPNSEPLERVGIQDVTAHVNFTAIARAGKSAGANEAGFCHQQHFLVGIAHRSYLRQLESDLAGTTSGDSKTDAARKKIRAFQTLTHPDHFGRALKVLTLSKGKELPRISGLRYARPI